MPQQETKTLWQQKAVPFLSWHPHFPLFWSSCAFAKGFSTLAPHAQPSQGQSGNKTGASSYPALLEKEQFGAFSS